MPQDASLHPTEHSGLINTGGTKRARRPRALVACDSCRARKVKCDGGFPCSSCTQHSFQCSYKERQPYVSYHHGQKPTTDASFDSTLTSGCHLLPEESLHQDSLTESANQSDTQRISPSVIVERSPSQSLNLPPDSVEALPVEQTENSGNTDSTPAGVDEASSASEFYGPSGTFYFLSKLRSQVNTDHEPDPHRRVTNPTVSGQSVADLLHSSDYGSIDVAAVSNSRAMAVQSTPTGGAGSAISPSSKGANTAVDDSSAPVEFELQIQRECVRLYFENLHCVHPILDQKSFLEKCETEIWGNKTITEGNHTLVQGEARRRFLALFNIVLAIGAITAGETSLLNWDRTLDFLERSGGDASFSHPPPYTPTRIARLYFEKAKALTGDVFEASSFETAQTLFLMAVFCQNALKPHSCFMYNGIALRTAFATGIPTRKHAASHEERLLWWSLYSFEIEMSSSAGRQSFLQTPEHYGIPMPVDIVSHTVNTQSSLAMLTSKTYNNTLMPFVTCMVDLARILADVAANANVPDDMAAMEKSTSSLELEKRVIEWRRQITGPLNLDSSTLNESESIMKQKVVLQLRYLNLKVLIHRPFLLANAAERMDYFAQHILSCVEAARETIQFVYNTYSFRPYFRTWWYNCMYVLDATMVLLYVMLTNMCPVPIEAIFSDIGKSLEIFSSMKALAVARRCSEITRELLHTAQRTHADLRARRGEPQEIMSINTSTFPNVLAQLLPSLGANSVADRGADEAMDNAMSYENMFTSLVDTDTVYDLLNFGEWNAWSDIDFGEAMTRHA